jgi:hyperosmotically inducible periplasmic protein
MRIQKIALSGTIACLALGGLLLTSTGCAGNRYQRSTGAYLDDKGLTTRVKTAMFRNPDISGFDVSVDTFRGVVQLNGFVDRPDQKELAGSIAREVAGVRQVANNLQIKPAGAVGSPGRSVEGSSSTVTQPGADIPAADDPAIMTPAPIRDTDQPLDQDLNRNLDADRDVDLNRDMDRSLAPSGTQGSTDVAPRRPNIDITSSNGRATIRGTVQSEDERRSIAQRLLSVPGINSVDNQLQVNPNLPDR